MALQINTIKPQIQIQTIKGEFSIRQPKPEVSIKTERPKLNIDSELPKVKIDQYQPFSEAGLKNYIDLTKENAMYAKQKVMEAIARYVDDGNRLAMIEISQDPIPELAEKNAWGNEKVFDIGTLPKSRPEIDVTGRLDINFTMGKVSIDVKINKPIINITRNKVNIYLKQKPEIDIRYVDEKI